MFHLSPSPAPNLRILPAVLAVASLACPSGSDALPAWPSPLSCLLLHSMHLSALGTLLLSPMSDTALLVRSHGPDPSDTPPLHTPQKLHIHICWGARLHSALHL